MSGASITLYLLLAVRHGTAWWGTVQHSVAWCSMWKTGKNHEQEDRVISSKISRSENRAKLYLTYKDHKKEKRKTRPIGTANSSNTRGFANCISDLLEAVANSEENSYEVISSEDLLHNAKNHNKIIMVCSGSK